MKKRKYPVHEDFRLLKKFRPPLARATIPISQMFMHIFYLARQSNSKVRAKRIKINVNQGSKIRAIVYTPKNVQGNMPCVIYYHGGGFVFNASPHHFKYAREYAEKLGCKVIFPDYRLAPKHKFPVAFNDCLATYKWVLDNANALCIDKNKIALSGDSAGGQLALSVSLAISDEKIQKPCAQILIYPATGSVEPTPSMLQFTDSPVCCSGDIERYYDYYLDKKDHANNRYFAVASAKDLSGMPATYVETAEFDCLRDEGIFIAQRLKKEGVRVKENHTKGTVHGYDFVRKSQIVCESLRQREQFLSDAFANAFDEK